MKNTHHHTHTRHSHSAHSASLATLTEDARELLAATVDVAGEKVGEARNRLMATLDKAKEGMHAADQSIRKNPYKPIALAAGIGVVLGYFLTRRGSK